MRPHGRRYAFDMDLGNVRGAIPIHGFLTTTPNRRLVETDADAESAWATSRLELQSIPPEGTWRESFWVRPSGF